MLDFFLTKWNKQYFSYTLRSYEWKAIRKIHLSTENACRACDRKKHLQVHHIIPVHIDKSLELDPSNLITLCSRCHLLFGHLGDYKSWNEDVVKDCDIYNKKIKHRPYKND